MHSSLRCVAVALAAENCEAVAFHLIQGTKLRGLRIFVTIPSENVDLSQFRRMLFKDLWALVYTNGHMCMCGNVCVICVMYRYGMCEYSGVYVCVVCVACVAACKASKACVGVA
jgi:hypothetical protein